MKKKIIYLWMLTAGLSSCGHFLDIKPYDKTIPETAEDFSAIIHEMCDEIDNAGVSYVGVKNAIEGGCLHKRMLLRQFGDQPDGISCRKYAAYLYW